VNTITWEEENTIDNFYHEDNKPPLSKPELHFKMCMVKYSTVKGVFPTIEISLYGQRKVNNATKKQTNKK